MPTTKALETIGDVTPSTKALAARVVTALEASTKYTVDTCWGYDADPNNTEHHSRLAVDFMVSKAGGKWITDYLWAHRVEFGLVHMIHLQRIKSTRVSPGVWRSMDDRGSTTANHMDHVHVLFDGTAATIAPRPTVSRKPAAPTFPGRPGTFYGPKAKGGNPGYSRYLAQWQKQMIRRGWAFPDHGADGYYGDETAAVAKAFQEEKGLEVDELIGAETWAAAWLAPVTP